MRSYLIFRNKKCRIYAACGVSQTPILRTNKRGGVEMATSSITKNFVVSGERQVEKFANVVEA